MKFEFRIEPIHAGMRVDRYLAEIGAVSTRSQIERRSAAIHVNGRPAKTSYRVCADDRVVLELAEPPPTTVTPERIELDVLYEDNRVVVLNKGQGIVVHPGAGNPSGTIANALVHRFSIDATDPERPGIVHRLDKDTSGVLIAAKDVATNDFLVSQFATRKTRKTYLAVVKGHLSPLSGSIDGTIGRDPHHRTRFTSRVSRGKRAATEYRTLCRFATHSYLMLHPLTGRTHQLRVHMHDSGAPILGDPVYARRDARFPSATLMLHAYSLTIRIGPEEAPTTFVAPLPARMRDVLRELHQ